MTPGRPIDLPPGVMLHTSGSGLGLWYESKRDQAWPAVGAYPRELGLGESVYKSLALIKIKSVFKHDRIWSPLSAPFISHEFPLFGV